ncbi:unnamed protein product, partial [Didymodactylos carnosus]
MPSRFEILPSELFLCFRIFIHSNVFTRLNQLKKLSLKIETSHHPTNGYDWEDIFKCLLNIKKLDFYVYNQKVDSVNLSVLTKSFQTDLYVKRQWHFVFDYSEGRRILQIYKMPCIIKRKYFDHELTITIVDNNNTENLSICKKLSSAFERMPPIRLYYLNVKSLKVSYLNSYLFAYSDRPSTNSKQLIEILSNQVICTHYSLRLIRKLDFPKAITQGNVIQSSNIFENVEQLRC